MIRGSLRWAALFQLTEHEAWLLANSVPAGNSEDDRIRQCADNIGRHLVWPCGNPSAGLLEMLYRLVIAPAPRTSSYIFSISAALPRLISLSR